MMSVLKSRQQWSQNYCLVADAPTSKMDSNYSKGFYETLGNNFRQSIVMTYDFMDMNKKEDINVPNIGNVVRLTSLYPDGDGMRRDGLSTEIALLD